MRDSVRVAPETTIDDVKIHVEYHPWNLDLWKMCIPIEDKQQFQDFHLDDDKMLYPTDRVSNIFPDNLPEACVHIMIKASGMSSLYTFVRFFILMVSSFLHKFCSGVQPTGVNRPTGVKRTPGIQRKSFTNKPHISHNY